MQPLLTDLRSGIRMLVKYPTLSIVAIVTFGLGIGLTTTVFSVVNGALFKGLPFPDPGKVVAVVGTNPAQNQPRLPISVQDLAVFDERLTVFEKHGAFTFAAVNLSAEEGRPERYSAGQLTVAAFEALGVLPAIGRGLQAGDDRAGAEPVLLLGHEVWRDRFGASDRVLGQKVRANGVYRTVVGVMPERYAFPVTEKMWIPLTLEPLATVRGKGPSYQVVGRLKDGVSMSRARAEIQSIAASLATEFPDTNRGVSADVRPYAEAIVGSETYALLFTMLGAGIGVLLIACVNVSNLLVARASLRRKEVAVRLALGAGRLRVIRQHLTEVLVLATVGAGLGMLITSAGMRWFLNSASANPPPFWMSFETDYRVLLFIAGVVLFASLFAGALPAFHASRTHAGAVMKDNNRSSTSAHLGRFTGTLVVIELALSCGLLIAAGLMIKSVVQLKNVKMPFAVENILTGRINLPRIEYPDIAACVRFYEELLPRLQALPGIEAVTLSDGLPAAGNGVIPVQIEGQAYAENSDYPVVREGIVTPGYFDTFQTPVRGREFTRADIATSEPVVIVNESFARKHYPEGDPIGRRMRRGRGDATNPWLTVVGVVPDLLMQGVGNNNQSPAGYYIPIAQSDVTNFVSLAVRTRGDAAAVTPSLRAAVTSLDADLAVYDVRPMTEVIRRQTWFYTVFGTFFMAFGLSALFLAAAGLYGVMSFAVTQRAREMSVRAALGARGSQLVRLVMRRSAIRLALGLTLGLMLGLVVSGWLQPVLYYVNPRDPFVITLVMLALGLSGMVASFLPARRVTKIDPAKALTAE